jgi:hypothetical protein
LCGLAFLQANELWYRKHVKRLSAIRYLFAALAIAGLILAPIATPATAMPVGMSDEASMTMPADMPCCPDQAPMPGCGKDCLFMAACSAPSVYDMPREAGLAVPLMLAGLIVPGNDAGLAGLSQRPPPRPPKI